MVSQKEIIEALRHVGCSSGLDVRHALANRIEAEGIAPPDGVVFVKQTDVCLTDSQWVNIVNHKNCYADSSKEDAVEMAVKMTENRIAENVAMLAVAPKGVSDEQ